MCLGNSKNYTSCFNFLLAKKHFPLKTFLDVRALYEKETCISAQIIARRRPGVHYSLLLTAPKAPLENSVLCS